jgi:lysozyme
MKALTDYGLAEIKASEGLRLSAYLDDAGVPTIGYGSTKYENGQPVQMGDTITHARAEELLRFHIKHRIELPLLPLLKVPVDANQYDSLVSLIYNIGIGAFTTSTLLRKLNAGDIIGAADEFVKWRNAGGKANRGLLRRRAREMEAFLFGRAQ